MNIVNKFLPKGQYLTGAKYNSICLHHTAGGSAQSTVNWWIQDSQRIATPFIIDRDGTIYQVFPLDCWAYHLYVAASGNKVDSKYKRMKHDVTSIGIELASWGQLVPKNGQYVNYVGKPVKDVIEYKYKGYQFWETYTQAQIDSLKELLLFLTAKYNIPIRDNYDDIFDINLDALNLKPGIYSHVSYRTDKVDAVGQPNVREMLNSLKL